jgi:heavy metal translocating P-type ATPase
VANVFAADEEKGASARAMLRLGLAVFFTMNVMVFTMALWSEDVYPAKSFANPFAETLRGVFRWATLVFSLPVLYLLGGPIAEGVAQSLRRRVMTTDLLILAGIIAAYSYSINSVLKGSGHVYFEVGAMVMVFVSIGRWLEAKGKHRAGTSLDKLTQLLPDKVRLQDPMGQFHEIGRDKVRSADVVRILPGERFPVDGVVIRGAAIVDEQIVTGESMQVAKSVGDRVYGGTLNFDGDLWIEVTSADGQETLSRIINMVRTARSAKGRHERIADRIAAVFIPAVCIIAIFSGWWHTQSSGLNQGILTSLSVVLIACPCALGMATPMAVWAALGRAAQAGLLFRSGVVLEKMAAIQYACFDKTGTLTTGTPIACKLFVAHSENRQVVIEVALALASGSHHVLSRAIVSFISAQHTATKSLKCLPVETWPGQGLTCEVEGVGRVFLGSQQFLQEHGMGIADELAQMVQPSLLHQQVSIGWNGVTKAVFLFVEELRPEAAQALSECRSLGLEMHLLSGDHQQRAIPLGDQFGITSAGNLLPEDKALTLEKLKKRGCVAMVGDGLNDAPALATADVGVALGCGADVSRDAAGVCLLSNDLRRFPWAVGLARETLRVVKQNLFWAFVYNTVGIALAACGRLNPIWAALAMALSSVLVIANSLRLGRYPELAPVFEQPLAKAPESLGSAQDSTTPKLLIEHSEFVGVGS